MNYKKLIGSRNLRLRLLSLLDRVPDRIMIQFQYRVHTGRKLNLKNPQRFTEKMQYYKLYWHDSAMLRCTDKFAVREFVKERGLKDYLIPLIGIYGNTDDINFDSLPEKFVAKTTDGGGGNQVFVCRDKSQLSKGVFLKKIKDWLSFPKPKKQAGREWAYENGFPRRIIVEELLGDELHKEIPDYKFWCFAGQPLYCQVIKNRSTKETIDFFDMEWNHMPFRGLNKLCDNDTNVPKQPLSFEEMKVVATKLAQGFPFVRVDLYDVKGRVYFGELTFYPAGGYGSFTPDSYDFKLGSYFTLKNIAQKNERTFKAENTNISSS